MAEQPATLHQKQTRSRSRVLPPGLMYTMRGSMPYFVSALRVVDEWKRQNAKRADAITQAEYDVSAKYVKSTLARSLLIEDLLRFVDDTVLDIDFMVQLPSIEKCLEQWWEQIVKTWVDNTIQTDIEMGLGGRHTRARTNASIRTW